MFPSLFIALVSYLTSVTRLEVNDIGYVPVTAYNSVPGQTDDTPCIGAQGTDICTLHENGTNTCAANFLPLGTLIEIEDLGSCIVRDRMNSRYYRRIDWYMNLNIADAKTFGVKRRRVFVKELGALEDQTSANQLLNYLLFF